MDNGDFVKKKLFLGWIYRYYNRGCNCVIPIRLLTQHLLYIYLAANASSFYCAYLTSHAISIKIKMPSSTLSSTFVNYSIHVRFAVKTFWLRCEPSHSGHPLIISQD